MKIIEVLGFARSGHHAMINWIVKNLAGQEYPMGNKLKVLPGGLFYINEGNFDQELTLRYVEEFKQNGRVLMISYEESPCNFSILNNRREYISPLSIDNKDVYNFSENYRIIFIRDFYDNLASRLKSNELMYSKTRDGVFRPWDVEEQFIDRWKSYAKMIIDKKCISLKFEDWLESKTERNLFIRNFIGTDEHFDNKVSGTNSSFDNQNFKNRIDLITIPERTKDLIMKDTELHYLIGKLGYDYRKL